jgi:hypothetical protein
MGSWLGVEMKGAINPSRAREVPDHFSPSQPRDGIAATTTALTTSIVLGVESTHLQAHAKGAGAPVDREWLG